MNKKQSTKLKFEKPMICETEFIACNVPGLIAKSPSAVSIAAACQLPMTVAELPVAAAF